MTEIQAVLCGYYGKGNGGDEALLVSMLEMLPPHVKPLVLSANPRATSKSYGVKSYDRMNSGSVVRALKESQVLILGGGSLIQDATTTCETHSIVSQSSCYFQELWSQKLRSNE